MNKHVVHLVSSSLRTVTLGPTDVEITGTAHAITVRLDEGDEPYALRRVLTELADAAVAAQPTELGEAFRARDAMRRIAAFFRRPDEPVNGGDFLDEVRNILSGAGFLPELDDAPIADLPDSAERDQHPFWTS